MVYESDLAGTVVEILAQEGDTLPVGDPIARVGDASEVVGGNGGAAGAARQRAGPATNPPTRAPSADQPAIEQREPAVAVAPATPPAPATPAATPSPAGVGADGRVKASPIARRIAKDRGLDLQAL